MTDKQFEHIKAELDGLKKLIEDPKREEEKSKTEEENSMLKYQSAGILALNICCIFLTAVIVRYLIDRTPIRIDFLNIGNIIFKSFGLSYTIFVPLVLVDGIIYSKANKANKINMKFPLLNKIF